jgi:very-short-patch-repair endonuclease
MGDAEKKLWYHLRRRKIAGYRFRRQVPIAGYIADFACLSARLIIEVDGGQHNEPDNEILDTKRTVWLEARGYRVLRFWNSSVLSEIDSVTETIFNALELGPSPTPTLPLRGRE